MDTGFRVGQWRGGSQLIEPGTEPGIWVVSSPVLSFKCRLEVCMSCSLLEGLILFVHILDANEYTK